MRGVFRWQVLIIVVERSQNAIYTNVTSPGPSKTWEFNAISLQCKYFIEVAMPVFTTSLSFLQASQVLPPEILLPYNKLIQLHSTRHFWHGSTTHYYSVYHHGHTFQEGSLLLDYQSRASSDPRKLLLVHFVSEWLHKNSYIWHDRPFSDAIRPISPPAGPSQIRCFWLLGHCDP